ncbi:MAG: hypothetical protein Q7T46_04970 [Polaromonas sp.]|nr:hypothetical protein [Polaromonas sp.]
MVPIYTSASGGLAIKVHILDAQAQAFHQSHATAIEQRCHHLVLPF